ncbi:MAG: hypothetical protein QXF86_03240 [Candidatus Bilamarchaeaceae archaeon]
MAIYSAARLYLKLPPPQNIQCIYTSGTGFIFTFDLPIGADYAVYSTDNGQTWKKCFAGQLVNTTSDGINIQPGNSYTFIFKSIEEEGIVENEWSQPITLIAVSDTKPDIVIDSIYPMYVKRNSLLQGIIFKLKCLDDGGAAQGCRVNVVLKNPITLETISSSTMQSGVFKNSNVFLRVFCDIGKTYLAVVSIQNAWGTVYKNAIVRYNTQSTMRLLQIVNEGV